MKARFLLSAGILGCFLAPPSWAASASEPANAASKIQSKREEVPIFVIAGQSNALGYGKLSETADFWSWPMFKREGFGFHYWQVSSTQWEPGSSIVAYGAESKKYFGPDLVISSSLQANNVKDFYIFKYAVGESSLGATAPPQKQWRVGKPDGIYAQFQSSLKSAIKQIEDSGKMPHIEALFWMQGETDAYALSTSAGRPSVNADGSEARRYSSNLSEFIDRFRQAFDCADAPIILGKIKKNYTWWKYADLIRAADDEMAKTKPNVSTIETTDLPTYPDNAPERSAHYTTVGQAKLGERFYDAYRAAIRKKHIKKVTASDIPESDLTPEEISFPGKRPAKQSTP
jgi:hypothetical protein